jgi:hypothetical protein
MEGRMSLLSSATVLSQVDSMAIVLAQAYQLARARLASAGSPPRDRRWHHAPISSHHLANAFVDSILCVAGSGRCPAIAGLADYHPQNSLTNRLGRYIGDSKT